MIRQRGDIELTDRQMAVIYAAYKQGRISIDKERVSWLYEMNADNGEDAKEVRTTMLEAIPMIIDGDYESASGTFEGLFEHFDAMQKSSHERHDDAGACCICADSTRARVHAMADSLGLSLGPSRTERMDAASYMGYQSLDEMGITMHDLGYVW